MINENEKDKIIAEFIKEMHPEILESFEYAGFVIGRAYKKFGEAIAKGMEGDLNSKEK